MDEIIQWVQAHLDKGHDATITVIAAPGTGNGSWCFTCREYGPRAGVRILTPGEVR